jgi:hypothetical protein
MLGLSGKSTTGRLLTLGREPIGQFAAQITAFETIVGKSRHHFASFADNTDDGVKGGMRFTASACKMVVGLIIGNIETGGRGLPVQWPSLSSDYEAAKEKFVGGLGQWRLTDAVIEGLDVQKRWGEAGRSVGVYRNPFIKKIGFAAMRGGKPSGKIRPSTYAFWNEFGTNPTQYSGGQPPRPVFIPTYQQFARKYLPKLADAICDSLDEDFKRLAKNIGKLGGKFIGEKITGPKEFFGGVVTGPTQFIKGPGADKYEKELKKQMAASGADKWLTAHEEELRGLED